MKPTPSQEPPSASRPQAGEQPAWLHKIRAKTPELARFIDGSAAAYFPAQRELVRLLRVVEAAHKVLQPDLSKYEAEAAWAELEAALHGEDSP